jgi:hypothetical protein
MWHFFLYYNQIVQSQCDRLIFPTVEGFREAGGFFLYSCHHLCGFSAAVFRLLALSSRGFVLDFKVLLQLHLQRKRKTKNYLINTKPC